MRILAITALAVGTVLAQDAAPEKKNTGTNVEQPVVDFYDSISDHFRQSRRAVDLIAEKGIPAEEIPAVLTIARRSSASPNSVIEARKSGKQFSEIARTNKVSLPGDDFVTEANIAFLSDYHGRSAEEVRALHRKGASFVDINQQYRRVGMKPKTEKDSPASKGVAR